MYVTRLPITQFEGIMTNIDHRFQMSDLTWGDTYNHREFTSLGKETMFDFFKVSILYFSNVCR